MLKLLVDSNPSSSEGKGPSRVLSLVRKYYYDDSPLSFCQDMGCLGRGRIFLSFEDVQLHNSLMHAPNPAYFCQECHFITIYKTHQKTLTF